MGIKNKFTSILLSMILSASLLFTGCTSDNNIDEGNNENQSSINIGSDSETSYQEDNSKEDNNEIILSDNLTVHFIDTGNSDAILIDDNGTSMIIDAGDNDDENMMVNYLKKVGIKDIKYLVSTHAHADHAGGLDEIVKNFEIENAFVSNGDSDTKTYRDFILALSDKGLNPSVPLEDKKFKLKNAYFEVFNTNGGSSTNNESLVVLLTNGEDKMLFTGDAEEEVEYEILDKMPDVDLLKIGHHGSHSSSTDAFLDKTKPEYAVILCGRNNKYGHPHRETMQKLKDRNIKVYRTDQNGDIVFTSTGHGLKTKSKGGNYKNGSSNNEIYNEDKYEDKNDVGNNLEDSNLNKVYWTENGKVYHKYRDCSGLSRSKNVLSGSISESGKPRLCKRCQDR